MMRIIIILPKKDYNSSSRLYRYFSTLAQIHRERVSYIYLFVREVYRTAIFVRRELIEHSKTKRSIRGSHSLCQVMVEKNN